MNSSQKGICLWLIAGLILVSFLFSQPAYAFSLDEIKTKVSGAAWGLVSVSENIGDGLMAIVKSADSGIRYFYGNVDAIFDDIASDLVSFYGAIPDQVANSIGSAAVSGLASAARGLASVAENVGTGAVNLSSGILDTVGNVAKDMGAGISNVAKDVGAGISGAAKSVSTGVSGVAKDVASGVSGAANSVVSGVSNFYQGVNSFFGSIGSDIVSFYSGLLGGEKESIAKPEPEIQVVVEGKEEEKKVVEVTEGKVGKEGTAGQTVIQPIRERVIVKETMASAETANLQNAIKALTQDLTSLRESTQKSDTNLMQNMAYLSQITNLGPRGNTPLTIGNPTFTGTAEGFGDDDIPNDITVGSSQPLGSSSTGTSTFSGGLVVATGAGSVGIGTSTVSGPYMLGVAGPVIVGGESTSTFESNVNIWGNLAIGQGTTYITATDLTATQGFSINSAGADKDIVLNTLGAVGFNTSTPWAYFSVDHDGADNDKPVLVVADEGTSTPSLLIDWSGKVGIATSAPATTLSVGGSALIGSNLTVTGVLDVQGGLVTSGSLTPPVGIGTATPALHLEVAGGGVFKGTLTVEDKTRTGSLYATSTLGVGTTTPYGQLALDPLAGTVDYRTPAFVVQDSGTSTPSIYVDGGYGRVGFGTSSPYGQVAIEVTGEPGNNANESLPAFVIGARGTTTPFFYVANSNGNVGIGTANPLTRFQVNVGTNQNVNIRSNASLASIDSLNDTGGAFADLRMEALEFNLMTGNVGIGTATIGTKLEVAGGGVFKGTLYTEATSTASSFNATSTLNVATGTPGGGTGLTNALNVGGNAYISGGLGVGVATTSPGGLFVKGSADIYDGILLRGGQIRVPDGTVAVPSIVAASNLDLGIYFSGSSLRFSADSNNTLIVESTAVTMDGTFYLGGSQDTALIRDAAATLALRNGTNAQTFRVYNTWTDASNLERLSVRAESNVFKIEPQAKGTGTQRDLALLGGKIGIATTSPYGLFSIEATSTGAQVDAKTPIFVIGDQGTTTSLFVVSGNNGYVGIGTNTPWGRLSVELPAVSDEKEIAFVVGSLGTSTPALAVYSSGITTIDQLQTGALSFDTDAGLITWIDMPVTSASVWGTVEGYVAEVDASTTLAVYSESDGKGGIFRQRVGIATSSPGATFSVVHATTSQYAVYIDGDSSRDFVIDGNMYVGVGTTTPRGLVAIDNTASVPSLLIRAGGSGDGNIAIAVDASDVCKDADGGPVGNCVLNADIAELFPVLEPIEKGDVVMFDSQNPVHITKADFENRDKLAGIISTNPAIVFEGPAIKVMGGAYQWGETSKAPLALAGRIPVKVKLDNGPIKIGDPITISSTTPGVGVKAVTSGRIVGYALADLLEATTTPGAVDTVMVLAETGYWNNPDEDSPSLLATIIDAVKEWLSNAIVFVKELIVDKITTKELCVGNTCVTEDQLKALLSGQISNGQNGSSENQNQTNTGGETQTDTAPPVITLNGAATLEIEIGSVYSDPGATVLDPAWGAQAANPNLGYKVSLDGGPEIYPNELVLDTSAPAEYIITYIAVDQAGNTGTATRTVVVFNPNPPPEPVPSPEPVSTSTPPSEPSSTTTPQ